ncbi:ABC transporter ATP-binding protein [Micromonospora sp. NPDC048830]|uniref:ABC transporter ATP-binding protein n=1 Tax=Micromonospora sp. NPDC048830 TaxID=3364257 RepID=UPI00371A3813
MSANPVLDIRHLSVRLHTRNDSVQVVDDVSWHLAPGKTLALVGESGCGKTVSALSLTGLWPAGVVAECDGEAWLEGQNLMELNEARHRRIRGTQIGMVFQDPLTAFNPARKVGPQVADAVRRTHPKMNKAEVRRRVQDFFVEVGISEAEHRYDLYPHELSGGMRQRALVAMAIANEPRVLIADEPTTALDVTMQAQVLDLLQRLQRRHGMSIVLITHDVGVVAGMADDVAVVYAGKVVEFGPVVDVLTNPRHPYTRGLLAAIPGADVEPGTRFVTLPGLPPDMADLPSGCAFAARCELAHDRCSAIPALVPFESPAAEHQVACWAEPPDISALEEVSRR